MSFDLDMASFELQNRPSFTYNIPNIMWLINKKFVKMRSMHLGEIIKKMSSKLSGKEIIGEGFYMLPDRPAGGKFVVSHNICCATQCVTYKTAV